MRFETPGADFVEVKPPKVCKRCKGEILLALVRHVDGQFGWHNFNRIPKERDGRRYYTRHACPR